MKKLKKVAFSHFFDTLKNTRQGVFCMFLIYFSSLSIRRKKGGQVIASQHIGFAGKFLVADIRHGAGVAIEQLHKMQPAFII
ncbi:MAG: hypothetical protein ACLTYI_05425 [Christensenellales bacterium]